MQLLNLIRRRCPETLYLRLRCLYYGRKRSVSQAGQDFWVFGEVFNEKREGSFLEIGSADGISLSNTLVLEKRYGWRGLCIEANPLLFKNLQRVRNAICLNVCLDSREGDVSFLPRGLGGGIVGPDTDNNGNEAGLDLSQVTTLRARTLASVLAEQKIESAIDYLSIDVEGAEERVLDRFPFTQYRFNCLTIERPKPRLAELLQENGYLLVKTIPRLDSFYIHEAFQDDYARNTEAFWKRHSRW